MMRIAVLPTLVLAGAALFGASTQTWEMNTYSDFLKGQFDGVSLFREGQLRLAPGLETVFSSDQPSIWAVARAEDGSLYLGTGHRGRVYKVTPEGAGELLWEAAEPEVFALVLAPGGDLFVASSPNGKVYRIRDGKAEEYFAPESTYIWSLAVGPDGSLYVGTGVDGVVYKVTASGEGEAYYKTGQTHVTALAVDSEGRLLAGTEPNGILYRISEKDRAFVLYDANLPEIRALVPKPDGTVYVAAMGGSVARQSAAAAAAQSALSSSSPVAHTSITVSAAQGGVEIDPAKPKPAVQPAPSPTVATLPVIELSGVEKSALFKVHADHTVEKLWTSTTENAYDLVEAGDRIVFATDQKGRLYELEDGGKVTLLVQTNQEEAMRVLDGDRGLLVATGNMGMVYRVGKGSAAEGSYQAPVHDAARVARWGKLSWHAGNPEGGTIAFETRTGNSARPDDTWSAWSEAVSNPAGSQIASPNARYIQWRAHFRGVDGKTPALDSVNLAYLPRNSRPAVSGITVSSASSPGSQENAGTSSSSSSATAAYSITVTDTGEEGASTVSGTSTQRLSKSANDQITVAWEAEDPDGDPLIHALYFRGEGEREWKLLEDSLKESSHVIDSDALADGKYYFKVIASDRRANPTEAALEGERTSAPVLVDHTPPRLVAAEPIRDGDSVEVVVEAQDAASALRRCEYSLNAGPWTPVAPDDGIIDSKFERFVLRLNGIEDGEQLLVVRSFDSAGNAGLVRVLMR